jgi:hypothetical protein
MHRFLFLTLLAVHLPGASLFSVGPDGGSNASNGFTAISTTTGAGAPSTLDPTLTYGYNGGLTFANGVFYTIANDSNGNSWLQNFTLGSTPSTPGTALGSGFLNGLTYDSADGKLYAVTIDNIGVNGAPNPELDLVSTAGAVQAVSLASLIVGSTDGGLTFDPITGLFYFLSDDGLGASRVLSSISLNGTVTNIFTLGDGTISFNGGLLYDPGSGGFYTIGNDGSGNSSLYAFNLNGANTLNVVLSDFAVGFNNVGLTETPEPSSAIMFSASLAAIAALKFKNKNRRKK